jgi:hypothetical protein
MIQFNEKVNLVHKIANHFQMAVPYVRSGGKGSTACGQTNELRFGFRPERHTTPERHRSVVIHEMAHLLHHSRTGSTRKDDKGNRCSPHGRFFFKCLVDIYTALGLNPKEHYWTVEYASVYTYGFQAGFTNQPHEWRKSK